ncbi:hypothetical protein ACN08P_11325 [Photobacterium leiognathi subsp. mandapamensis]|uniref:hypothetical protein n=1 Tax=Photobacterium leiognathi TaxID=553611 RepID=UPI003AF351A2
MIPQIKPVPKAPPAAESIAQARQLFNANSKGGLIYDNLPKRTKAMICFGARLGQSHIDMKLSEMDEVSRAKVHRLVNEFYHDVKPLITVPLSQFK